MAEHFIILGRSVAALLIFLFITRVLGKQALSNMTFHDFVAAVILGATAANLAFNEKIQVTHLLVSLGVFTAVSFLLSKWALKSRKIRKLISGTPTVLIQNGKILEENMKKNNYTLDSLNEMLREKDIFDIDEVDYAMLESNGNLSVLRKREYKNITLKDLNILPSNQTVFPVELIMDGQIMNNNLKQLNLSHDWLMKQLRGRKKKPEEVFYAVKGTDGKLYLDCYSDQVTNPIDKE